jgi:chemotaxis protein histidine kinase CheA
LYVLATSEALTANPMIALLKNPLTPLPSKGRFAPRLVLSLAFVLSLALAGLLFAASTQAQGANAPESTTEAPPAEAAPESSVPSEQTVPPATEQVSPTGEEAPPTIEQTPPVAEGPPPPSEQTPPAAENPPPASEPTPPPGTEQTPPISAEAPPGAENAPPALEQETTEKQAGEAGGEANSEERATEGVGDSQSPPLASGSDHKELADEVAPTSSTTATTSTTDMETPVISLSAKASQTPTALESLRSSERRQARQISRELAAFGASMIATGSVRRWLDTLETSSVYVGASPVAMSATGGRARDRNAAIQSHTSGPGPGPAPGGTSGGGSATGAGSGAAPSAASMLMAALLQAAPTAMQRLCVSQPSWQTSFFALIPERPG